MESTDTYLSNSSLLNQHTYSLDMKDDKFWSNEAVRIDCYSVSKCPFSALWQIVDSGETRRPGF